MEMRYDGQRIRDLLAAQGRTQAWLADVTEYNPSTVSEFLTGARAISERFAGRAARHLGVPVEWLQQPTSEAVPA